MLTWQHSGFSVDASVRISLADRDVPEYFQSLEDLLRYCARPVFALNRLSVVSGTVHRPERVRYTLPRHKRGNWVGPGRTRKSTRHGASGVIELTPFEFLDRLAKDRTVNGTFASIASVRRGPAALRSPLRRASEVPHEPQQTEKTKLTSRLPGRILTAAQTACDSPSVRARDCASRSNRTCLQRR